MRALLLVVMVAACGADDAIESEPAARPCARLRDHLVDLRVSMAKGSVTDIAQHRAAMQAALGEDFVATCEQKLSTSEIDCSLEASDLNSAAACSRPSAAP